MSSADANDVPSVSLDSNHNCDGWKIRVLLFLAKKKKSLIFKLFQPKNT
jgi:hypothetical protein